MKITDAEKLAMFREAVTYHSTKDSISDAEIEWIEWAKKRITELESK